MKPPHRSHLRGGRWHLWLLLTCWGLALQAQPLLTVTTEGIESESLTNVLLLLSIEQQKQNENLVEGRIHRLHQKAPEEIRRALEPFGYYRVEIASTLTLEGGQWQAYYRISPGEPVRISKLEFEITGPARMDSAFAPLLRQPPLHEGEPFNHQSYEQLKRELQHLAEERGYFDAHFTNSVARVDLNRYQVEVRLQFESGPRYRFGNVTFNGDHPFNTEFLARYPSFTTDTPFDARLIANLQQALIGSDYFSAVEIKVERAAIHNRQVPISVTLTPRPRNRYQLGGGYGTDTGLRGQIGYDRRWTTANGHRLGSELRLSQIRNTLSTNYTIPLQRPESDRLVYRGEYRIDKGGDIESRRALLGGSVERTQGEWRTQWGVSYQLEDFEIGIQQGHSRLLIANGGWVHISGREGLTARSGRRIGLELRGAGEQLGSDANFLQGQIKGKWIIPLGQNRLLLSGEAGATIIDQVERLPPSLRLFAGGDYSIRGYAYRSVGPTDSSGAVIGGRRLLLGAIEFDWPVAELWRGALFIDSGNAFNDLAGVMQRGAGVGIRRTLPVGLLRLDVAQALTLADRPWRLHLTIGLEL